MSINLAEAARLYAASGWHVLPLHTPQPDGRCSCVKGGDCDSVGKHPRTRNGLDDATTDPETIRRWWGMWPDANVGLVTGVISGIAVVDVDGPEAEAHLAALGAATPTRTSVTAKGRHLFFSVAPEVRVPGAVRFRPDLDLRGERCYVVAPPSLHRSGHRYTWDRAHDMGWALPLAPLPAGVIAAVMNGNGRPHAAPPLSERIPEGQRNATLASLAGSMRRRGASEVAILAALREENATRCDPPLNEDEVRAIARSVGRYAPGTRLPAVSPAKVEFPSDPSDGATGTAESKPGAHASGDVDDGWAVLPEWPGLPPAALYGLAGEIVSVIAPHSEADPAAILGQLLVAFGNCVGRKPFFSVEGKEHHANLFAILIGLTSSGRKGTAESRVRQFLRPADPAWDRDHIARGLSSGEGLITAVRDSVMRTEPIREGGRVTGTQQVLVDEGVTDKRLLVIESEFSGPLRVMTREGNLLSVTIRESWDDGMLRTLTKNSPLRATDAHISIIGHITAGELRRYLDRTDVSNGFANRFLMLCVRRAQCLPEGGLIPATDFVPATEALRITVERAKAITEMTRDADARARWAEVYPGLSEARPGLLGAVTGRAAAQVLRLSMVYALLDQSPIIRVPHLNAAIALWEFSEASARYVFIETLGDPLADALLAAIRAAPEGMTRAEMYDYFSRNKSRDDITKALRALDERGLVECVREETGGRPTERWLTRKARYTRKGSTPKGATPLNAFNAYTPLSEEPPLSEPPEGETDEPEGDA